jgi:hypothetical protein
MERLERALVVAVLTTVVVTAAATAQPSEMQQKLEFPHAGVALAVPSDFQRRRLNEPFDVLRYVLERGGNPQMAVSLSAFPVGEGDTAEAFGEAKLAELRKHVAIRQFKLLKTARMPVAGVTGHAIRMSYTFGGIETTAAQLYFIREVADPPIRLCYLLTVEERERESQLLPVLGEVVRTVKFLPLRHPGELEPPELGEPLELPAMGFSVRPPVGWFADTSPLGASMGQVDYLLGGVTIPMVRVMVGRPGPGATAEQFVTQHLDALRETAEARNVSVEVVSSGEAELADRSGWQFVARQAPPSTPASPGGREPSAVIVQRSIFAEMNGSEAGGDEPVGPALSGRRSYSLVCIDRGEKPERAVRILERVAEGFSLLADEAGNLTTATAPTSAPAASAPASRPAVDD